MAMLINGHWSVEDKIIKNGIYDRQVSVFNRTISTAVIDAIATEPGRFHLIASWSCPWSHRIMLLRQLKSLTTHIPLHMTGGKRVEGYSANFGKPWSVPGSDQQLIHLHQLYTLNNPLHTGRPTVPVLWDSLEQCIVSNESDKLIAALDAVTLPKQALNFTLKPGYLANDINSLNDKVYHNLSNGVYRAGFAQNQQAYEEAVAGVFAMLDELETRLSHQRYLMGAVITEADWRLFATLVRFDIDYFMHSRCSIRRLTEYPYLWSYTRDLYSWYGIAQTINFDAIHLSNITENDIVAVMPLANWSEPHDRDTLGPVQVATSNDTLTEIQPSTFTQL